VSSPAGFGVKPLTKTNSVQSRPVRKPLHDGNHFDYSMILSLSPESEHWEWDL